MKTKILILLIGFLISTDLISQKNDSGDLSMGEGKSALSIGVGVPYFGNGYARYRGVGYRYTAFPTVIMQYEYGVTEKIPQSILGVGPYIAYSSFHSSWKDNNSVDYWDERLRQITIAAKVFYHHKFLVGAKWDVYAAAFAGIHIRTYSFTSNDPKYYDIYDRNYASVFPTGGAVIGGRYYFTNNFGVYAEAGFGASYVSGGLNFKF